MVTVFAPLKREFMKELLDGHEYSGYTFTFKSQDGMQLHFTCTPDDEKAVDVAKGVIRKSEFGAALSFSVKYDSER